MDMSGSRTLEIINLRRFNDYGTILPFILYFPFGLLLLLLRFFIFLHVILLMYILPNRFPYKRCFLRVMLSITGIPISIQGFPNLIGKKNLLISNHISSLDPFLIAFICPNVLILESPVHERMTPLFTFSLPKDKSRDEVLDDLKEKVNESSCPLLFFPERIKTNGRECVLKLSTLPFETECSIQPVVISAKRFLFNINVSTHSSSVSEDLLWCLFLPTTYFCIKFLPLTEKKVDETPSDFSSRVHYNMAKSLNLKASIFTFNDILESIKRKTASLQGKSKEASGSVSSSSTMYTKSSTAEVEKTEVDKEFAKMVLQVKSVLPDTPENTVIAELKKTRDVDISITNILEGKTNSSDEEKTNLLPKKETSFKASNFERTASARQLSFSERKQAMLEAARQAYKEKHKML